MTLFEFSSHLSALVKGEQYNEALQFFKANKIHFGTQLTGNAFIVAAMLKALRKTGYFDEAKVFVDNYGAKALLLAGNQQVILNYGWLLYDTYKAENQNNETQQGHREAFHSANRSSNTSLHKKASEELKNNIIALMPILLNSKNEYYATLATRLFNLVLKGEKQKASPNWALVNRFCNAIDPALLSDKSPSIETTRKGQKTIMELASDKENWYAYQSAAFLKLQQYDQARRICEEAKANLAKFHYANDIWFDHRLARIDMLTGDLQSAATRLNKILRKKKEWFIYHSLADILHQTGKLTEARSYAAASLLAFGDLEKKTGVLQLMAQILLKQNQNELAIKHLVLAKQLLLTNQYKIPQALAQMLEQLHAPNGNIPSATNLIALLRPQWHSFQNGERTTPKEKKEQWSTGIINKILNNNEKDINGFVRTPDQTSYYFTLNADTKWKDQLKPGVNVEFIAGTDKNNGKPRAFRLKIKKDSAQ